MEVREAIFEILSSALKSVTHPLIAKIHIEGVLSEFFTKGFKRLIIIGFGKASCQMARTLMESIPGDLIKGGVLITKYGYAENSGFGAQIKVFEAGHPIPDKNGIEATGQIIRLLRASDEQTLLVCLISGGGSALFVSPYEGISLQDKQKVTDLLLKSGADIIEINSVRKHLSRVKGGRSAEIAYPARIIAFIISDVIGDRLDVIASGPTAPDTSTFQDAINVIKKYKIEDRVPKGIIKVLEKGRKGLIPETPKADSPMFRNVTNIIVGNNQMVLDAAKDKAQTMGFEAEIISSDITGEAKDVGKWLAKRAKETRNALCVMRDKKKICLISGGETTVTVKGDGKGGRNMELALSFAMQIEGIEGITLLSAGTDGTDGPTNAAGAIVDGKTITKARNLGLDPDKYLEDNDSYSFFRKIDSLLITGPTGTNVMDVQIILVE
jgi:hydroxypyruvate reductase/glycerate 2-kinase